MDTIVCSSPRQSAVMNANSPRITTTLYDVIAAMQTMVGPDEDELVVIAIDHLLREGWITFVENDDPLDARRP